MAALPHERPVTLTNRGTQMSKVSLIGNSLAYLLCQTRQRANDYRPGMTPEDVRAVFEKSLRGEQKKRAATRNDTRKERAVPLSPLTSGRTRSKVADGNLVPLPGKRDSFRDAEGCSTHNENYERGSCATYRDSPLAGSRFQRLSEKCSSRAIQSGQAKNVFPALEQTFMNPNKHSSR